MIGGRDTHTNIEVKNVIVLSILIDLSEKLPRFLTLGNTSEL
jgi:hypothetical protein